MNKLAGAQFEGYSQLGGEYKPAKREVKCERQMGGPAKVVFIKIQ